MPQSLSPLARPGERLLLFIRSFHLYHNRPINKTVKFGREGAANARNIIALARSGCASRTPLRHPGRRVIHGPSGARSLRGMEVSTPLLHMVIYSLAARFAGRADVVKIDVDRADELASAHGVRGLP